MPELDASDRSALDAFVADLRALYGDALLAAALTGEAASRSYRPRHSELTTTVLLREITPAALRSMRPKLRGWRRRRIATPLLLDPVWIDGARDVFPLEFLELAENHRMLFGERDPFADVAVDLGHLRFQVEEQLRGKWLHLWEAYLEVGGSKRSLRQLLLDSPRGFEVILRGLLHVAGGTDAAGGEHAGAESPVAAAERALGLELPVLQRLEALGRGEGRLSSAELDGVFDAYLEEVRSLVRAADAL